MELAPLEAFERYSALGPDFMTWLLVRIMEDEMPAPPSEPGLQIDFEGPLVFVSDTGEANKITLAGDEAVMAPEVKSALRQGKKLQRAKVVFTAMEDTWKFALDGETFDLKGIKLPTPNTPDIDMNLSIRVDATLRAYHLLDEMFEAFLPLRLSPEAWKEEASRWKKVARG